MRLEPVARWTNNKLQRSISHAPESPSAFAQETVLRISGRSNQSRRLLLMRELNEEHEPNSDPRSWNRVCEFRRS